MSPENRSNEGACAWRNETASHACERVALLARIAAQKAARIEERRSLAAALARIAAVEARVAKALAEHDHNDTCQSVLSPDAGYPCNCWRAALAASPTPTGPETHEHERDAVFDLCDCEVPGPATPEPTEETP